MVIGLLKEPAFEKRVALPPDAVKALKQLKVAHILVESAAGVEAFHTDNAYQNVGATISDKANILAKADVLIRISPLEESDMAKTQKGAAILSMFQPLNHKEKVEFFKKEGYTTFSMELVPRTTRAQAMDVLSSMATVAGYKAVLMAASHLPKFFPMFMTAAGTIIPAKVLVLGAGVAGLQAIATARRLGGVVHAFDVRSAVKEEVESLGAKFVEVKGAKEDKAAGGYAVEQTEEYKRLQQQAINDYAAKSDVIIATAQIPGRKAPLLISEATLKTMKPGSVVVDLAASSGGNCAGSKNGNTVVKHGITIIGESNLPSSMPADASKMFGKNIVNFLKLMIDKEGSLHLNFEDDIVKGTCLTHNGEVVNEWVKGRLGL